MTTAPARTHVCIGCGKTREFEPYRSDEAPLSPAGRNALALSVLYDEGWRPFSGGPTSLVCSPTCVDAVRARYKWPPIGKGGPLR